MKELHTCLRDKHIDELREITRLISDQVDPVVVILFGHYAGSKAKSAIGGYETLIVTEREPSITASAIRQYIGNRMGERRTQIPLHLHLYTRDWVNRFYGVSYFLQMIGMDGILLYHSSEAELSIFARKGTIKIKNVHRAAQRGFNRHFQAGSAFLENARENLQRHSIEAAGFSLYLAVQQYFIALEYVYYGFHVDSRDLTALFKRVRHASGELNELLDLTDPANRCFLSYLTRFYKSTFHHPEKSLPPAALVMEYVKRAEQIETTVREEWEQREQSYLGLYQILPASATPMLAEI